MLARRGVRVALLHRRLPPSGIRCYSVCNADQQREDDPRCKSGVMRVLQHARDPAVLAQSWRMASPMSSPLMPRSCWKNVSSGMHNGHRCLTTLGVARRMDVLQPRIGASSVLRLPAPRQLSVFAENEDYYAILQVPPPVLLYALFRGILTAPPARRFPRQVSNTFPNTPEGVKVLKRAYFKMAKK